MNAEYRDLANSLSDRIGETLNLPSGARFYRCALQVNPFSYLQTHDKQTKFKSEDEYNAAIVEACLEHHIEVIAVTDHYRVKYSSGLVCAARQAGIHAFNGFEAVSKDGVHFLCLFDQEQDDSLERFIGECGVHATDKQSPIGNKDSSELLECANMWGASCIAAHVASKGGLLKTLSGQSRVNVWRRPDLLACALPGPIGDAPDGIRPILQNKDAAHQRDRPVAIVNASDVNHPEDIGKDSASCFIKMSTVSVEALRQAFLDPESRVRLHSDPEPDQHTELVAMTWQGGFLDNAAVHFNVNLNIVIGGRGTGKSTIIESIRYVLGLDPIGEEAQKAHQDIVRHVLQSGTKVSLLVRSHRPSQHLYLIERSVPNPPIVKDKTGEVLGLLPSDVIPGAEIFGQHEISELARSPKKRTLLIERFVDRDPELVGRKSKLCMNLERSRRRIVDVQRDMMRLDERLAALPGLEATQERFRQAGLEERLNEKSQLVREERLFVNLDERINQYRALHDELAAGLPVDLAFVSDKALDGLPNAEVLAELKGILETLSVRLKELRDQFGSALDEADGAIAATRLRWNARKTAIDDTYEALLRDLQKSKVDGAEFIQLREQIEELRPLRERMERLGRDLEAHNDQRRKLLLEWDEIKATDYRQLAMAAKRVSRKLSGRVQVKVTMAGDREPLEQLLREVGGNLSSTLERLRRRSELSLSDFALQCRNGKDALMKNYGLTTKAAERIAQSSPDYFLRIEELELPATTEIALNTASAGETANWQTLEALSTGQKATAVLLLLLLDSEAPLVIDQPEDDLDNRFITDGVVPIMRQEKCRRQFIFSTHNANIPVLGDAELILGLATNGAAKEGSARIAREHMASIDSEPVRDMVEDILEGGKAAFEMRRSKYGF